MSAEPPTLDSPAGPGADLVGQTVGSYRVVRKLGQGGMGAVYLGEHPEIESRVAIKVLRAEYVTSADFVKRFLDEARAVNRIGHRGIVRIHDCYRLEKIGVCLVMEYLRGESLLERIQRKGALSVESSMRFVMQACTALSLSHKAGIIHRDLKPANLFIVSDPDLHGGERLIVLDFGIAKLLRDPSSDKMHTATGTLLGSPLYMSPEQCLDSGKVDHRTDIFSLGVVAYEMLSGQCPYTAESLGQLALQHRDQQPALLRTLVPQVPPALEQVVEKILAYEAGDRIQTMAELRKAVDIAVFGASAHTRQGRVERPDLPDEGDTERWQQWMGDAATVGSGPHSSDDPDPAAPRRPDTTLSRTAAERTGQAPPARSGGRLALLVGGAGGGGAGRVGHPRRDAAAAQQRQPWRGRGRRAGGGPPGRQAHPGPRPGQRPRPWPPGQLGSPPASGQAAAVVVAGQGPGAGGRRVDPPQSPAADTGAARAPGCQRRGVHLPATQRGAARRQDAAGQAQAPRARSHHASIRPGGQFGHQAAPARRRGPARQPQKAVLQEAVILVDNSLHGRQLQARGGDARHHAGPGAGCGPDPSGGRRR